MMTSSESHSESSRKRLRSSSHAETDADVNHQEKRGEIGSGSRLRHPFKANFNDHFETSAEAIQHVFTVVNEVRQLVRPSAPEKFTIYDPYYCAGTIVEVWKSFGIGNVVHENRDFYADIANGTVPSFDMLVTNPPFSDDHIQRMLTFLLGQKKPWAFVAPEYIATKDWYKKLISERCIPAPSTPKGNIRAKKPEKVKPTTFPLPPFLAAASTPGPAGNSTAERPVVPPPSSSPSSLPVEPFYIIPPGRYDFEHPLGVGHEHSHFKSMWFVGCGGLTSDVIRGAMVALSRRAALDGVTAPTIANGLQRLKDLGLSNRPKRD